ncbi:MAG TPA: glycosyltransferase family 39 protein [Vicinamibacterales bacterium]|nr:glycosyltransferase family 39 protein [Vicinamibacterales bacterium]
MTRLRAAGLILCFGIAAAALLLRVPSIAAPLGIDQGLWASAVRGMARGLSLYQDVWEQRPPGIYFVYLAGFRVLGWTAATVVWLDILAAAATTILVAAIAFRLSGRTAAAVGAALYAAFTMPAWLYGYGGLLERSVCETFIVVCVAGAAYCAVVLRERVSMTLAVLLGLAAGAAIILKPNAGIYAPFILGWLLVTRQRRQSGDTRTVTRLIAAMIAGGLIVPLLTVLWLWQSGLLPEARLAVVDFNRWYVGEAFTLDAFATGFAKAIWLRAKTDPLWLAGGAGCLLAAWDLVRRRPLDSLAGLAIWWGAAAALTIAVQGVRLYSTYFIQAFPPLVLLATWTLMQIGDRNAVRRVVGAATAALMLVLVVQRGYVPKVVGSARVDLAALRGQMPAHDYLERFGGYGETSRGYSARANAEVAEYIRQHTQPDDRVFLFGINGASLYFLADRLPAHRFLRANFFATTEFPNAAFRVESVVQNLRQARPAYVVFERLRSAAEWARIIDALPQRAEVAELLSGYKLEATIEDFTVYRRID